MRSDCDKVKPKFGNETEDRLKALKIENKDKFKDTKLNNIRCFNSGALRHKTSIYDIRVLKVAAANGLEINFKKCQFLKRKIEFLGCVIENGTIHPSPSKTLVVEKYPLPKSVKQIPTRLHRSGCFHQVHVVYPVKSPYAQESIDKLKLQQTIFGNPSRIIADRGSAFTTNEFETYCSEEEIQHLKVTAGIPTGSGQIERMHRILIPFLSKLSHDDPTKWFKHVSNVQRVINSSSSRSTKYTPFELMMGTKTKNKKT
ncbi:hypothetical protein AVEN_204118-1 [Araneus ventricosus]|uniref:Integrase catalytic domain-containing protein n=1 Tax=Araneus ventricosus TaxID=182803 RepID=A0A4Y2RCZ1_ARAVE|nr:hypothetical protein AVEN_204118-1 [Araneus ventricosus]